MREIKFRAWDKHIEEMTQPISPLHTGDYICDKDFVLMQFTGLLDKNGKEIYEGDIVFVGKREYSGKRFLGFNNNPYVVKYLNDFARFNLFDLETDGGNDTSEFDIDDDIKIIGNIYENPELINK